MADNQQLLNLLSLPSVLLDPAKQQQAVTQLCQLMNTDSDEPQIVQPSIKLLSSHQPLTRITVMTLVRRHVGRNPDIMPQATNALLKCAVDPNPAVRRAAVSTLACMPDSADISLPVISSALRDRHPSVQRAAVTACRLLPRTNPRPHSDHVDELYRLISSEDPLLVHACLTSLDVILEAEGGVVINRAMVRHLSGRSRSLPDAVLVTVLRLLSRYQPSSDEERLSLMNRLDWLLTSPKPQLVEAALELFFHLCSGDLRRLRGDAVGRAAGALCGSPDGPREWRWAVLQLVRRLGPEHQHAFSHHYRYFVPRPSDGRSLSVSLVLFLWRLAGPGTAAAVSRQLTSCLDSECLQTAAVRSLLRLGRGRPELAASVVDSLCRLVRAGECGVRSGITAGRGDSGAALVAGALTAADLAPLPADSRSQLLSCLLSADLSALPPPALCRLLESLGRWGEALPAVPALLRQLALCDGSGDNLPPDHTPVNPTQSPGHTPTDASVLCDPSVRVSLLECAARLFLRRPAQLQLTLGVLMERAVREGGAPAAQAARWYALLKVTGGQGLADGTGGEAEGEREDGFVGVVAE